MTCLILENIGMKGEYVLSGREAVQRVWDRHQNNRDYFAVILDWKTPEMKSRHWKSLTKQRKLLRYDIDGYSDADYERV